MKFFLDEDLPSFDNFYEALPRDPREYFYLLRKADSWGSSLTDDNTFFITFNYDDEMEGGDKGEIKVFIEAKNEYYDRKNIIHRMFDVDVKGVCQKFYYEILHQIIKQSLVVNFHRSILYTFDQKLMPFEFYERFPEYWDNSRMTPKPGFFNCFDLDEGDNFRDNAPSLNSQINPKTMFGILTGHDSVSIKIDELKLEKIDIPDRFGYKTEIKYRYKIKDTFICQFTNTDAKVANISLK